MRISLTCCVISLANKLKKSKQQTNLNKQNNKEHRKQNKSEKSFQKY